MALGAFAIAEVQNGGADTNAGWFDSSVTSPGLDYTQGANLQTISYTDLVFVTTTSISSATRAFVANDAGNTIRISAGASFITGLYEIVSVAAGVATVDRNCCSAGATSGTAKLGGALSSIGQAGSDMAAASTGAAGNSIFIKYNATAFTSTNTSNVSGGKLTIPNGGVYNRMAFVTGYDTNRVRGNGDINRPLLKTNGANTTLIAANGSNMFFENLIFDGRNGTDFATNGLASNGFRSIVSRCKFQNFASNACTSNGTITNCEFTGNSNCIAGANGCTVRGCEFYNNGLCINMYGNSSLCAVIDCNFYNNTGAGTDAISTNGNTGSFDIINCTFYKSGRHGINIPNTAANLSGVRVTNCIFDENGGYGIACASNQDGVYVTNCAFYNNTSGDVQSAGVNSGNIVGKVTLTGIPFTNATGNNFSLNNTAGAGAACQSAGIPGAFPRGLTIGYRDIGAVQHQASGGVAGGVLAVNLNGGIRG